MKTLFSKYVTVFAVLLAFCTLMIVLVLSSSLTSSATDTHYNALQQAAVSIDRAAEAYGSTRSNDFFDAVSDACRYSSCDACIADKVGVIIYSTESLSMRGKKIKDEYYNTVYSDTFRRASDNIGGLLSKNSIFICRYMDDQTVLLVYDKSMPGGELDERVVSSLVITVLWTLVLCVTVLYFVTERSTAEIREIAQVSAEFAEGNFKSRVTIPGNTELAKTAEAFNKMADSLEALETMRSSFLANVSHDLRTPMTIIAGYVNNMLDGSIPPEKHSYYLEIINGEIQRLSRLVSTLLDISRLEAGTNALRRSDFCLSEIARLVLISCEDRINDKQLDIIFDNDEDIYVNADMDAIYKCLFNLLDNAIKFAPQKGFIKISITNTVGDGIDKARFAICNNGDIVPPEELPQLFDRFYKSDRSRNLDKTGTGLGLYIVRTTIVAHGENITCTSDEQNGTEFVFTLPKVDKKPQNKEKTPEF